MIFDVGANYGLFSMYVGEKLAGKKHKVRGKQERGGGRAGGG